MNVNGVKLAALAMAAVVAAGCSSGNAPPAGTSGANALVCRHYLTQRNWVKNLTQPTLADAVQFEADIGVDEIQAAGKLRADLTAMVRNENTKGNAYYAASTRVYNDCT